jgi:hypothetical protein
LYLTRLYLSCLAKTMLAWVAACAAMTKKGEGVA